MLMDTEIKIKCTGWVLPDMHLPLILTCPLSQAVHNLGLVSLQYPSLQLL